MLHERESKQIPRIKQYLLGHRIHKFSPNDNRDTHCRPAAIRIEEPASMPLDLLHSSSSCPSTSSPRAPIVSQTPPAEPLVPISSRRLSVGLEYIQCSGLHGAGCSGGLLRAVWGDPAYRLGREEEKGLWGSKACRNCQRGSRRIYDRLDARAGCRRR